MSMEELLDILSANKIHKNLAYVIRENEMFVVKTSTPRTKKFLETLLEPYNYAVTVE